MNANGIVEHFLSRAAWVDREDTVDRVIIGDPEREVDRCLVTWMPGFTEVKHAVDRGFPLLVCDDGTSFWSGIQLARDLGHPVIRVHHGTSEEPGMATLARYIDENLDDVGAEHLPRCEPYRRVIGLPGRE